MKWIKLTSLAVIVAVFCFIIYLGAQSQLRINVNSNQETLFQVASFQTFSQGAFDGTITYADLAGYGDFGIGTLNGLDGEMVALNGIFYQISVNGVPREIAPSEKTPFAMVTFFEVDQTFQVTKTMNYTQLTTYIDQVISPEIAMFAIKIHGEYDYVQTRSVPKQTEPYPTLYEVIENQTVFTSNNVTGTAVGFRLPSYMNGVNVEGYHLHFITDDNLSGGHLLDCIIKNATVEVNYIYNYHLMLPENP